MTTTETSSERADLLESLATHRHFLRYTVRDLTDEQATRRTTVSALDLGKRVLQSLVAVGGYGCHECHPIGSGPSRSSRSRCG